MNRKNNRKVKSILNKLTQREYDMIINGYIRRVHNLNLLKRIRFAFNVIVKGIRKKRSLVIKVLIFSLFCLSVILLVWLLHFIIFTTLIYPIFNAF